MTIADFFTNLFQLMYWGSRTPSSSHAAAAVTSQARILVPTGHDHALALDHDQSSSTIQPKSGEAHRGWTIKQHLVSTINQHRAPGRFVRVVSISDTHMKHAFLNDRIPDGDILIHCGDVQMTSVRFSRAEGYRRVREFNEWLGTLPHKHKIVIGGNHDNFLEDVGEEEAQQLLSNATYVCNSMVTVEGLNIWGSPVSWGSSKNDAFQQEQADIVDQIPTEADIVVTHGHPLRRFKAFRRKLKTVSPIVHFCGHYHQGSGVHFLDDSVVTVNSSVLNWKYRLAHPPNVVDIPTRSRSSM